MKREACRRPGSDGEERRGGEGVGGWFLVPCDGDYIRIPGKGRDRIRMRLSLIASFWVENLGLSSFPFAGLQLLILLVILYKNQQGPYSPPASAASVARCPATLLHVLRRRPPTDNTPPRTAGFQDPSLSCPFLRRGLPGQIQYASRLPLP